MTTAGTIIGEVTANPVNPCTKLGAVPVHVRSAFPVNCASVITLDYTGNQSRIYDSEQDTPTHVKMNQ